jgi:predicted kinase
MSDLILVRGLPGSGKSTFAKTNFPSYFLMEADHFFYVDGKYCFDASKLGAAHSRCQSITLDLLKDGMNIIVCNTFTTKRELKPYFEIAKETHSNLSVITMNGNFGSIHNVPEETMVKMKNRFEHDISELWQCFHRKHIEVETSN